VRSGKSGGPPPGARVKARPAAAPQNAAVLRRELTPNGEPCPACIRLWEHPREALPHARLIIVSSAPMIEAFGGGTETRYVCLDCGHTVIHSTGRFGKGWH
jgi:hypothetical protein